MIKKVFLGVMVFLVMMGLMLAMQKPEKALSSARLGIRPSSEPVIVPGMHLPKDYMPDADLYLPSTGEIGIAEEALGFPAPAQPIRPRQVSSDATTLLTAQPLDTSGVATVLIPDLHVKASVKAARFNGTTWDVADLGMDVGWLESTSLPGYGGNTVLAGHIALKGLGNGPFRYLLYLTPGAEIRVQTEQHEYVYQVRDQIRVNPKFPRVIAPTVKPQLTLVTCSQWDTGTKSYVSRRVVFADLVRIDALPIEVLETVD